MNEGHLIGVGIIALVIAILIGGAFAMMKEAEAWQKFVDANGCIVVESKDSQTFTTVGPVIGPNGGVGVGVGTGSTEAQELWACDNGKRYWKRRGMAKER